MLLKNLSNIGKFIKFKEYITYSSLYSGLFCKFFHFAVCNNARVFAKLHERFTHYYINCSQEQWTYKKIPGGRRLSTRLGLKTTLDLAIQGGGQFLLNLRAGSSFPVQVCTVSRGLWVNIADTQQDQPRCNKVDAVRR